ncbi:MAG: 3-phosphoshikimate 1-carboxyvinyltransferase [Pseudomonadota bacterium]|nr:3-phosphoshikimate 1-carboxyvinyltransferase [Pseudomonadota bacterium]
MHDVAAIISHPSGPLRGDILVPGDKSISHRALMIGASAVGETEITGLLEAGDILATMEALRALGIRITVDRAGGESLWRVWGRGVGGLAEPDRVLDLGNSGTGARLLMGLLASHPFASVVTGDASLRSRPMARITGPLTRMGAQFTTRDGGFLPVTVHGSGTLCPAGENLAVASAQVKSAIMLAGLNTMGVSWVLEPNPSRDHTELMLRHFGCKLSTEILEDGGRRITLAGYPELTGAKVTVPGDISSAAFPLVAALLVPGSKVCFRRVGLNPLRAGLLQCLAEMGAEVTLSSERIQGGEPIADLTVEYTPLKAIIVPAERAPSMIDEYPILAVAAAFAEGTSHFEGVGELRVKESDRLAAMARGLAAAGVETEERGDSLTVHGLGGAPAGGSTSEAHLDHRIAMALLVLGAASEKPVTITDGASITTSFPDFTGFMNGLGAQLLTLDDP